MIGWRLLAVGMLALLAASCARKAHWGYTGAHAPEHWGSFDDAWILCAEGREQSPVDLLEKPIARDAALRPLDFDYAPVPRQPRLVHNTVMLASPPGNVLHFDGRPYELRQFHFHIPAEHRIAGGMRPMEMHFVHFSEHGAPLVVAVLGEPGRDNAAFHALVAALYPPTDEDMPATINPMELLPRNYSYVTYHGSLTTPPCTEGVTWVVMQHPAHVGHEDFTRLHAVLGTNARPVQPLNDRVVRAAN